MNLEEGDGVKSLVLVENDKLIGHVLVSVIKTTCVSNQESFRGCTVVRVSAKGTSRLQVLVELNLWARDNGVDVINLAAFGNVEKYLSILSYLEGDAKLKFFVWNWKYQPLEAAKIRYELV